MPGPRIVGVILAAGESARMGRLKPLLPLDGTTFLGRIIAAHRSAGIEKVIVVVGAHADEIRAALAGESVEIVENPRWPEGPLTSLIAGIDAAQHLLADAIMMHPVDHPAVGAEVIAAMCDVFARTGRVVVRPVFNGAHGHPVLFSKQVFDELRAAPPEQGARHVVHAHAAECGAVATDDEGVILNIDTPEDYEHLRGTMRGAS